MTVSPRGVQGLTVAARRTEARPCAKGAGRLVFLMLDHTRSDSAVGRLVNEDEGACCAVGGVVVDEERDGGPQQDSTDLVQSELARRLIPVQGVDIDAVHDVANKRTPPSSRVLDRVFSAGLQHA